MIPLLAGASIEALLIAALQFGSSVVELEIMRFQALDAEGKRQAAQTHQDGLNRLNDHLNNIHQLFLRLFQDPSIKAPDAPAP